MNEEDNYFNSFLENNVFELDIDDEIDEKLIDYLKNKNEITRLDLGSKIFLFY
jgi:hypothetical protein